MKPSKQKYLDLRFMRWYYRFVALWLAIVAVLGVIGWTAIIWEKMK